MMKFSLSLLFFMFLISSLASQVDWNRQYPLERLENVTDIDFGTDGYGFASGTDDLLLRFNPGTGLWDLLPGFGDGINYISIDYLDGSNGMIALAGGQGLIMTVDGGETWNEILLSPPDIKRVKIISPTFVIVIANEGVLKWQDGLWSSMNDPSNHQIKGGFILDEDHIWIYTIPAFPYTYSTKNGGEFWHTNIDIADIDAMHFYDELNGVATDGRKVYTSANGGFNWTLVSENMIHNSSNDITHGSTPNVIMAATLNGDPTISFDGGVTWTKFGTGLLNQRSYSIEAASDSIFYVGNDLSSIAYTEDQGETWRETSGPERNTIQDVQFVTRTTGFAVGQSGMILRTLNGGSLWEDISEGARSHFSIHGIDVNDLWIGTNQRILHSTDMGETWSEAVVFAGGNINKVLAISSSRILAGSSAGIIYRSNDGGASWDTMYNSGNQIRSIAKIDANTYMATGFNGVILRSNDQGESWTALTPPEAGLQYEDVSFLNGEGWMVTSSYEKTMWHTLDRGNTWDVRTLPIDRYWDGVYFISPDTGIVVGRANAEGRAYVTFTGGQTWNPGYILPFPLYGVTGIPNPNGAAWIYGFGSDIEMLSYCNAFPHISNFMGDLTPCEDDTILYTIQSENIDEFIWDFPSLFYSILGNPNNDSIYFRAGSNKGNLSIIGQNACGFSEQINLFIDLIQLPILNSLVGDEQPCAGDIELYWTDARRADAHHWIFPSDWLIVSDPNSDSVFVQVGNESGIITFNASNECATTKTLDLEVETFIVPDAQVLVSGNTLTSSVIAHFYQWYLDGELIPGATNSSFTVTEDGVYFAELIYFHAQCTTYTDTVNVIISATGHPHQVPIKVYPVPTNDVLYIIGMDGELEYSIADAAGRILLMGKNNTKTINVKDLEQGFYLLTLSNSVSRFTSKFYKE